MIMTVLLAMLSLQLTGCGLPQGSVYGMGIHTLALKTGTGQEAGQKETDAAVQHLLAVWSDYLSVLDRMYASELWALDYVDAYLESGDWSDLSKARTACIASARYLSELSMTEEDLSREEYRILTKAGIDAGYQSESISLLADSLEDAHLFIRGRMLGDLEGSVFFRKSVETLKKEVALQREYISCDCRYNCCETNYLLLTLGNDAMARKYWYSMEEKYPVLSTGCGKWPGTEAKIKAEATAYMDEEEELLLRQADLISELNAELSKMMSIVKNGEIEKLKASAYRMSDMPALLPMPLWYAPETTGYLSFILEEDGSMVYPEMGDKLEDADYGVYMQIEEVDRDEVEAYIAYVKNYAGLVRQEGNRAVWNILMPDYGVRIEWSDNVVTVSFNGEDVTFAPYWYIE